MARQADAALRRRVRCRTKMDLGRTRAVRNREASMIRKTGIIFAIGVAVAAFAGAASAQTSPGIAALDASLRGAVERKDVPGVVALVTDRKGVIYQGTFGVADVSIGRPL